MLGCYECLSTSGLALISIRSRKGAVELHLASKSRRTYSCRRHETSAGSRIGADSPVLCSSAHQPQIDEMSVASIIPPVLKNPKTQLDTRRCHLREGLRWRERFQISVELNLLYCKSTPYMAVTSLTHLICSLTRGLLFLFQGRYQYFEICKHSQPP